MGGNGSREQVVNHLNEVTTKALIEVTSICSTPLEIKQYQEVQCDVPTMKANQPCSRLTSVDNVVLSQQGMWNASANSPTLISSTGTRGHYYVVSVAGNTNLDGLTTWKVDDWVVFNGQVWERAPPCEDGLNIYYEENEACRTCIEGAFETMRTQMRIDGLRWDRGIVDETAFTNTKDFWLGRQVNRLDDEGNPIPDPASGQFTNADGTGDPIPNTATEFRQVTVRTGMAQELNSCLNFCKACQFINNTQFVGYSGKTECVASAETLLKVKTAVSNAIIQEASTDKDVFAAITSIIPSGADMNMKTFITNRVTNKLTIGVLTKVQSAVENVQSQVLRGVSTTLRGNSQATVVANIVGSLAKQKVFIDVITDIEADTIQKRVDEVNSVKEVAGTLGLAARTLADLWTSAFGIVIIVIMIVAFFAFLLFLKGFLKPGQGILKF